MIDTKNLGTKESYNTNNTGADYRYMDLIFSPAIFKLEDRQVKPLTYDYVDRTLVEVRYEMIDEERQTKYPLKAKICERSDFSSDAQVEEIYDINT